MALSPVILAPAVQLTKGALSPVITTTASLAGLALSPVITTSAALSGLALSPVILSEEVELVPDTVFPQTVIPN